MRHATPIRRKKSLGPIKGLAGNSLAAAALRLLGKVTRLQIVLLSIAACSIVLGVTSNLGADSSHKTESPIAKNEPNTARVSQPLELPFDKHPANTTVAMLEPGLANSGELPFLEPQTPAPKAAVAEEVIKTRTIKSGDNLSTVFQSVGLGAQTVYRITQSGDEGKALTRMFPGETLAFVFNGDDALQKIVRQKSALESITFTPNEKSFSVQRELRTPEVRQVNRSTTVTQSLALAANRAGISDTITMNMANIFGGVIDFVYDVRSGDRFTVLYEELYLDGKKIDEGNIIAAQYVNRDKAYNAFRYEHDSGEIGYYNEDGVSMRKAFLRAPLDFTRVSSGFNLKRLHPITKKVKPHRGIDYAAPTGTPVFSVGEGRVVASGYSNANGKYVFVKHGEAYTTKYLHLSRRTVKKGQRVKQGQIIGHVGCTGLCTGPHLHYEFLVNGVHRNPRTIVSKLPKAKKLNNSELPAFTLATAETQDVLRQFSAQFELAANQ